MYANRNTIPNEPCSPFYPSGIRLGTPMVTTRGMKEAEMRRIAAWIAQVVKIVQKDQLPSDKKQWSKFLKSFKETTQKNSDLLKIRAEVSELARKYPLFSW
jgi:glycine hydroxymethyltransferase